MARIHAEIAREGPITFARFMDLALYDPAAGYYRASTARPGRDGDFLTAPEAHPIFGAALSRAVADAWDRLDRPVPFVLREHGAGTGALAVAILDGLAAERPDLAAVIGYQPIEVEPAPDRRPRGRLTAAGHGPALTRGTRPKPGRRPDRRLHPGQRGARRAADAPGDRPRGRSARGPGRFGGRDLRRRGSRPVDTRPAARLDAEGITLAEGQRAEVCLAVDGWIAGVAADLQRGLLLLIDYGYPASELYDPVRRRDGTLRAYLRHRVHDDPYVHVGRQDLTAHVDLTAVERAAADAGLDHLGTTTQAEYLVGLGPNCSSRRSRPIRPRPSRATWPSARRSCDSSTRARWAVSGSWRSAGPGPPDRHRRASTTGSAAATAAPPDSRGRPRRDGTGPPPTAPFRTPE